VTWPGNFLTGEPQNGRTFSSFLKSSKIMQGTTLTPPVLWAQRKDRLLLTIDLPDIKDPKINITSTTLTFEGSSQGKVYNLNLELLHEIKPEESKWGVLPRHAQFNLIKKEPGFWERLLKQSGKHWYLKADWNRWIDEDDDEEGARDFDMSELNMGGDLGDMGDFGGGDEDEGEEDDDVPPLEEEENKQAA